MKLAMQTWDLKGALDRVLGYSHPSSIGHMGTELPRGKPQGKKL